MKRVVGRRLAIFPAMEMSDGEWAAWWGDYVGTLGDLPEAAIELGMRAYIREPKAEFMPKPGRLRELARGCVTTASAMHARAKASVDAVQRLTIPPRQRPDPAAIAEIVSSLRSRTTLAKPASASARPMPPPVSAQVGESGVSAELGALNAERGLG